MPLALLFAGPFPLYEALGWHKVARKMLVLRRAELGPGDPGCFTRRFEPPDLAQIRELYDVFNAPLSCTTLRDEAYWRSAPFLLRHLQADVHLADPTNHRVHDE